MNDNNRLTDKQKPELGLGTWAFGSDYWPNQDVRLSKNVLTRAIDLGITHFDTAPVYGNGLAEQIIGQVLHKRFGQERERFTIATKSFFYPSKTLIKRIDKSLRRLKTEWIDICYIHWPSPKEDMRPMMETLEKLKRQGKIKAIGVSNFSVQQIKNIIQAGRVEYYQVGYNLLWRKPEQNVIPFCNRNNITLVTYSSLAQGVLTGKYLFGLYEDLIMNDVITVSKEHNPETDLNEGRKKTYYFQSPFKEQVYNCLKQFHQMLKENENIDKNSAKNSVNLIQLALNWLQNQLGVGIILVGARTPSQLEELFNMYHSPVPYDVLDKAAYISNYLEYPISDTMFHHH